MTRSEATLPSHPILVAVKIMATLPNKHKNLQ